MKIVKKLLVIAATVIMFCVISVAASAATYGDLTYTVSNGEVTITDCVISVSGSIVIPDTIAGYPVTTIGKNAFYYCGNLENITIPASVTEIEDFAIFYCCSLQSITVDNDNKCYSSDENGVLFNKNKTSLITYPEGNTLLEYVIPDSVIKICDYAFCGWSNIGYASKYLKSITIPESVTEIGIGAFLDCDALESITIPEGVTEISDSVFSNCGALKAVTIPEGVTKIGDYAFDYCKNLESITIPESVTEIGDFAFRSCSELSDITLPNRKIKIGQYAFNNTEHSKTESNWENGILYIGKHVIDANTFSVEIKAGTLTIADYAFTNRTDINTVTIPESVVYIGEYVFAGCNSLTLFDVDENNEHYSSDGFALYNKNKTALIKFCPASMCTSFKIPENVTIICDYAFENTHSLENLTIPGNVKSIGNYAFIGAEFQSVLIESGVETIGTYAFHLCKELKRLTIGSIKKICDYAFANCVELESVIIENGVTSIGENAFYNCNSLENIIIPDSINEIGSRAFHYTAYYNAESNWDNGLLYIGNHLIVSKKDITDCTIRSGTVTIGDYALCNCAELTNIMIPDSVISIGNNAFNGCKKLESIVLPNNIIHIGASSFARTAYYNDDSNWENGILYIDNYLIAAKDDIKTCDIKSSTKLIGDYAFSACYTLETVTIPDSVTSIGNHAFTYCESLESVIIGNSVISIGEVAFGGCISLENITIPDNVTSINNYAFGYTTDENHDIQKIDNFVIFGKINTAAETYAKENNITFIALETELPPTDNSDDLTDSDSENNISSFFEFIKNILLKLIDFIKNLFA